MKVMLKKINLEQTQFIDLRNEEFKTQHKIGINFSDYIPKGEDRIQYKIYNFQDLLNIISPQFKISSSKEQKIIEAIIKQLRSQLKFNVHTIPNGEFVKLSRKNKAVILKHLRSGNPQCAYISIRMAKIDGSFSLPKQQILTIATKSKFALLMAQIFYDSFMNSLNLPNQIQHSMKNFIPYIQQAILAGLPQAFLYFGVYYSTIRKGKKAYEMYKNAEKLGYQPIASKFLGLSFVGDNDDIQKNFVIAEKYFNRAKLLKVYLGDEEIVHWIQKINKQKIQQLMRIQLIKSNEDTRSLQVSNFIDNKIKQYRMSIKRFQQSKFSSTLNFSNQTDYSVWCPRKTFYVVFSPLMAFNSRQFLVKDKFGEIQLVAIYNWEGISNTKLKLLHEVGTKITLNSYIRKLGTCDRLPIYRVENPNSVEIYKRTQKHIISDRQLRNHALNLFQRNYTDKAIILYKYLILKGAQEQQIIYSNLGVIEQNRNSISLAIKYYQASLKIKSYQKSSIRLAKIFIGQNQFQKALLIVNKIESIATKQKYLKEIQQKKSQLKQIFDFSKIIRKKHKTSKQITKVISLLNQQINFKLFFHKRQYLQFFKRYRTQFEQSLKEKFQKQQILFKTIQNIYKGLDDTQLKVSTIEKFYRVTQTIYKILLKNIVYPYSVGYVCLFFQRLLSSKNSSDNYLYQIGYSISLRQNYLENRIEDICLIHQEKCRYNQAEKIYRLSMNSCSPFSVKVAQLLFIQCKYQDCINYCQQKIQQMTQMAKLNINGYFKCISQLMMQKMKSLIKLRKYKECLQNGQIYFEQITKNNPYFMFQDFNQKVFKRLFEVEQNNYQQNCLRILQILNPSQNIIQQNKDIICRKLAVCKEKGIQYVKNIIKEIVRCLIQLKEYQRAEVYLHKIQTGKNQQETDEACQFYYQTCILRIMIAKHTNQNVFINSINSLQNQIDKNQQFQNKPSYIKFLIQQKLSLSISKSNIITSIKICEQIVKIDKVNLIFAKKKLFHFIKCQFNQVISILKKIEESQLLKCLHIQLVERMSQIIEKNIQKFKISPKYSHCLSQIRQYFSKILKIDLQDQQSSSEEQNDTIYQQQTFYKYQTNFTFEDQYIDQGNVIANTNEQFQEEQNDKYQNEISRFLNNGFLYIVIFDEKILSGLQTSQLHKFVCASDHFCIRSQGSTGIKMKKNQLRLKIVLTARLKGKLIQDKQNSKIKICYFDKRQNHDDYKRKNRKRC